MRTDRLDEKNLGDFFLNDCSDPLSVSPEFAAWRAFKPEYHALFERRLARAAGPTTVLAGSERDYPVINLASLDYLGMCLDPRVVGAQVEAMAAWGNGAAGVPLLSGMSTRHEALQEEISLLTGKTGTILYTSGFVGAIGFAIGLLRRGDVAILDERAHMSWRDGVRTAGATLATFKHNDVTALDEILTKHSRNRRVVIVDGLYSMDGDFADLPGMLDVANTHRVGLVVDEAHSIFADGPTGGGVTERTGEQSRVRMIMGTFSKALSMLGGFLSGDAELIDYLRYYSHPYIFSCALPPAIVVGILKAIQLVRDDIKRRNLLVANANYFRTQLKLIGLNTGWSESWIVPIIFGRNRELLFQSVKSLMENGLFVAPVDYPAVPEDQIRIRTTVSAAHTRAELDRALDLIEHFVARPLKKSGYYP